MINPSEQVSEELRAHAVELATRIRFLREQRKEGNIDDQAELEAKAKELGGLFPVDASVARIDFEVRDVMEVPNESQGIASRLCLRTIQVNNPKKGPDSKGKMIISLLPKGQLRENLSPAAVSEILPLGIGGI